MNQKINCSILLLFLIIITQSISALPNCNEKNPYEDAPCCVQGNGFGFCDFSQKQFSIEIGNTPKGLPVFMFPGDLLELNFNSKVEGSAVSFERNIFGSTTNQTTSVVLNDRAYVTRTYMTLGDTTHFFNKYLPISFVVPDNVSPELRGNIDSFKDSIKRKYGFPSILEYKSSQISCSTYFGHPLEHYNVVLIGTPENNQAISCISSIQENNFLRIERSPWNTEQAFTLTIYSDSASDLEFAELALNSGLLRTNDYQTAELFSDAINACELIGFVPGIDVAGDVCTVGKSCGNFLRNITDNTLDSEGNAFWCSAGGIIAIVIPGASTKWTKTIGELVNNNPIIGVAISKFDVKWAENLLEKAGARGGKVEAERALKEASELLTKRTTKLTDTVKPTIRNPEDLRKFIDNLPSDAKKVYNESKAGDNEFARASEVLSYLNIKEPLGGTLKYTETELKAYAHGGKIFDTVIQAANGQNYPVSVKRVIGTIDSEQKALSKLTEEGFEEIPEQLANLPKENNYSETILHFFVKTDLEGDYLLKSFDEYININGNSNNVKLVVTKLEENVHYLLEN